MSVVVGVATVVLVIVTGYYAWQNHQMVGEMRQARIDSVRPHLVASLEFIGTRHFAVRVSNVGQGPALDADLTLTFASLPDGPGDDRRRYRPAVVQQGEHFTFLVPDVEGQRGRMMDATEVSMAFDRIEFRAMVTDGNGERLAQGNTIADLKAVDDETKSAMILAVDPPIEKIARAVEKIEKKL